MTAYTSRGSRTSPAPAPEPELLLCPTCGAPLILDLDTGPGNLDWLCDCVTFEPSDTTDTD